MARGVAERMRAAIAGTPMVSGTTHAIAYTVSIGAAVDNGALQAGALLAHADAALYQAKGAGRNTVVLHAAGPDADAPSPQAPTTPAEAA